MGRRPNVVDGGLKGRAQLVGAGGGYDAGIGGERSVSSCGGGAMAALGRKSPTKDKNKTESPKNEGRPERRSRRSASVNGAIPGAGERIGGDVVG